LVDLVGTQGVVVDAGVVDQAGEAAVVDLFGIVADVEAFEGLSGVTNPVGFLPELSVGAEDVGGGAVGFDGDGEEVPLVGGDFRAWPSVAGFVVVVPGVVEGIVVGEVDAAGAAGCAGKEDAGPIGGFVSFDPGGEGSGIGFELEVGDGDGVFDAVEQNGAVVLAGVRLPLGVSDGDAVAVERGGVGGDGAVGFIELPMADELAVGGEFPERTGGYAAVGVDGVDAPVIGGVGLEVDVVWYVKRFGDLSAWDKGEFLGVVATIDSIVLYVLLHGPPREAEGSFGSDAAVMGGDGIRTVG